MGNYPIFFAFKDVVACGQFKALIQARGKALLTYEGNKWWMYGVQPGGMAASGSDVGEAFKAFNRTFGHIIRDIAEEVAHCPNEFEKTARRFFDDIDEEEQRTWQEARDKIRSGEMGVPQRLRPMKRIVDDFDVVISIIITRNPGIKKGEIVQGDDQFLAAA